MRPKLTQGQMGLGDLGRAHARPPTRKPPETSRPRLSKELWSRRKRRRRRRWTQRGKMKLKQLPSTLVKNRRIKNTFGPGAPYLSASTPTFGRTRSGSNATRAAVEHYEDVISSCVRCARPELKGPQWLGFSSVYKHVRRLAVQARLSIGAGPMRGNTKLWSSEERCVPGQLPQPRGLLQWRAPVVFCPHAIARGPSVGACALSASATLGSYT